MVTSNSERVPEFQRLLSLYGIEVQHASPFGYRTKRDGPAALLPLATQLLEQKDEKFWTKSVMILGDGLWLQTELEEQASCFHEKWRTGGIFKGSQGAFEATCLFNMQLWGGSKHFFSCSSLTIPRPLNNQFC